MSARKDSAAFKLRPATVVRQYQVPCPVCGGRGTVPHDFYACIGYGTSTTRERCKTCGGTGTTWATESVVPGV